MYGVDDKEEFYSFIEKIVSLKGEGWFNSWSESNSISNFHINMSDEDLSAMIIDPEVAHISLIDYGAMLGAQISLL